MWRVLLVVALVAVACGGEPEALEYRWEYDTNEGTVVLESDGEEGTPQAAGTPLLTDVSLDGVLADGSPIPVLWTGGPEPEPAFFAEAIVLTQCFQIEEAIGRIDDELAAGSGSAALRVVAVATRQALADWGAESGC